MRHLLKWAWFAPLFLGGVASAQGVADVDKELYDLQSLLSAPVVTATGGEAEMRALAPATTTVITRVDIARHDWRSLAEILRHVPGLYVSDDQVLPSLGVRGVSGGLRGGTRIMRVSIDGAEVNFEPDLAAFIGPEYIPMEAIERVEIAKGPLSALYGANAFLATVNVITRAAVTSLRAEVAAKTMRATAPGSVGASGLVSYANEHLTFLAAVSGERFNRSGLELRSVNFVDLDRSHLQGLKTANDLAQPFSGFFKLGSNSSLGNFLLSSGLQRLDSSAEFQLSSVMTHRSRVSLENDWANLRWDRSFGERVQVSATAGWARGAPTNTYSLFLTDNYRSSYAPKFSYQSLNGSAEATVQVLDSLSVAGGLEVRSSRQRALYYTETVNNPFGDYQSGDTIDWVPAGKPLDFDVSHSAVYLRTTYNPHLLSGLRLTGNLRVDQSSVGVEFPLQTSWRAAAAYQFDSGWVTKLVAGRAFQSPSGVMMFAYPGFGTANNVSGSLNNTNNAALIPQQVTSFELSGSGTLTDHLVIEASTFYQTLQNAIEFNRVANGYRAVNRSQFPQFAVDLRTLGVELALNAQWGRYSAHISGTAQAQITAEANIGVPERITGISFAPLSLFPNRMALVGLEVHVPEAFMHLSADLRWAGAREGPPGIQFVNLPGQPAYNVLDLAVTSTDLRWIDDLETKISFSVKNALGTQYAEPYYEGINIPGLGRVFSLTVRQYL